VIFRCLETKHLITKYCPMLILKRIKQYLDDYAILYGAKSMAYNQHAMCHLAEACTNFGSLTEWSAFLYESFNSWIGKNLHSGVINPALEIANRYCEKSALSFFMDVSRCKYHPTCFLIQYQETFRAVEVDENNLDYTGEGDVIKSNDKEIEVTLYGEFESIFPSHWPERFEDEFLHSFELLNVGKVTKSDQLKINVKTSELKSPLLKLDNETEIHFYPICHLHEDFLE